MKRPVIMFMMVFALIATAAGGSSAATIVTLKSVGKAVKAAETKGVVTFTVTGDPSATVSVTAEPVSSWIKITAGDESRSYKLNPKGTAQGRVRYTVGTNDSSLKRDGSLTIGGKPFAINQEGAACSIRLTTPAKTTVEADGGELNVGFTVSPADCGWNVTVPPAVSSWFHVTGPEAGTGNSMVEGAVSRNESGGARSGKITFAAGKSRKTLTIAQKSLATSESWEGASIGSGGSGKAVTVLTRDGKGDLKASGSWIFHDGSITATCPFMNIPISVTGGKVSFTGTGKATASGLSSEVPAEFRKSSFTLSVEGTYQNDTASGTFTISFSTYKWPSSLSGTWTSTRTKGGGINFSLVPDTGQSGDGGGGSGMSHAPTAVHIDADTLPLREGQRFAGFAVDGTTPYAAVFTSDSSVTVFKSRNGLWEQVGATLALDAKGVKTVHLLVRNATPYLFYIDPAGGNPVAGKLEGGAWTDFATAELAATGAAASMLVEVGSDGMFYISLNKGAGENGVSLLKLQP